MPEKRCLTTEHLFLVSLNMLCQLLTTSTDMHYVYIVNNVSRRFTKKSVFLAAQDMIRMGR
jgi:hypothetical protein